MSEPYDDPATDERTEGLEEVDVETLKAQLEKKEQDIQKLKGHWGSEKQQLVERLAKLEGRVEERDAYSNSQRQPEKDPFDLTEEDVERINNNPAEVVKLFKDASQKQMSAFVEALKARDEYYDSSIRETRTIAERVKKELDPERLPWKDTISDLRKNEKLANLDDDTLIEVAKTMGRGPAMEYRGSAGGGVSRGSGQKIPQFDPSSPRGQAMMAVAQGDIERAKKYYDSWARKQVG